MKLLPFNDYDLKTPRIHEALNETKDSSAIENIVTTHDSIYKVLTESGYKDENAKEVADYHSAIWYGYEIIKEKGFISTNVLVELHSMIEHNESA